MTTASIALLDQAELIQLSLNASRSGDSGSALSYLKEAASRADATAVAHFLLGAEYAQIRMYDRAIAQMEAAVALDQSLAIARFQLGLLLLTSGDGARALDVLQPLDDLGGDHALAQFGNGLIHLIRDEFADTLQCLARGIELNAENQALNADMQRLIDEVNKLPAETRERKASTPAADGADTRHILLSAYNARGE